MTREPKSNTPVAFTSSQFIMQFTQSIISVAALLFAAAGTGSAAALEARAAAVEFCTANNFQGNCVNIFPSNGQCVTFGSDFNDQVSSIHVQSGTTCTVFTDNGCSGNNLFIGSDVAALGDFNFNDVISSFSCSG